MEMAVAILRAFAEFIDKARPAVKAFLVLLELLHDLMQSREASPAPA